MAKNKEGSFRIVVIFMVLSMVLVLNWDKLPWLKNSVHAVFNPTLGVLLNWNMTIGMILILFVLSYLMTLAQKYTTDQDELKRIKALQKDLQKKSKEHRSDPKKSAEISKELMSLMPKQMKLGMRSIVYTGIPLILFYRWFNDFFIAAGSPKFFGFLGWFWFYFIGYFVFSSLMRKWMDVA